MVTTDPTKTAPKTRQDFTANDFFRRGRSTAFDQCQIDQGDGVSADDISARVHTLRHLSRWDV